LVLFNNDGHNFELQLSYSLAFLKTSQVYTSISGLVCCFVSYVLCYFWCSLLGADEVNRESWQLITAIRDEGDGLILGKWHS
jgi:NO-binding membrane sensor protein with MHYT domain